MTPTSVTPVGHAPGLVEIVCATAGRDPVVLGRDTDDLMTEDLMTEDLATVPFIVFTAEAEALDAHARVRLATPSTTAADVGLYENKAEGLDYFVVRADRAEFEAAYERLHMDLGSRLDASGEWDEMEGALEVAEQQALRLIERHADD